MKKLIPLLLLIFSWPALSAERQFDIELIVFKRAVEPEQISESWPNTLPAIDLTNVGSFQNNQYRNKKGVTVRPYDEYQLLDEVEKLKQHAGYEVLLHKVWRQGDQNRANAPIFHIRAGKDYSKSYNPDGSEKVAATEVNGGVVQEETIDNPLYELDGKLQIYVQHYLFLETELDLKAPGIREVVLKDQELELTETESDDTVQIGNLEEVSPTVEEERFLKSYRMKQKRRMRSTEIHYLDHPLMGIIVQVRRAP